MTRSTGVLAEPPRAATNVGIEVALGVAARQTADFHALASVATQILFPLAQSQPYANRFIKETRPLATHSATNTFP